MNRFKLVLAVLALSLVARFGWHIYQMATQPAFISYRADVRHHQVRLYWKDEHNRRFRSLEGLRKWLDARGQKLDFAMNAGMFDPDFAPQGLYIEAGQTVVPLDTAAGQGNFYLKPNGVFYLGTDVSAHISSTAAFRNDGRVAYATQSGPMLVLDGRLHPAFRPGSANVQIRNGVGILPNGEVLLAMSRRKINFYDFAEYFRKAGCRQALYLDGFVSRTYEPGVGRPADDGDFGVIIGVTTPKP
ncbi:phosphodiester glycosidase family protein [Hymenobacter properus]|uniref:Phosphodiester glycosidase family protein n=1 Tax=Hymenobacter properus TaxID=2791026 RepID=A0A931BMX3_9BACT|nr:phosphodiester glycosidase family protein [Hymenobacter properus]MBF9144251.1 phosphodiester glycosidase family protein [Hymenobacter properus]MBR7723069.1 phosphodiester glycosidase family protein [Microvirga sp. SRT04]